MINNIRENVFNLIPMLNSKTHIICEIGISLIKKVMEFFPKSSKAKDSVITSVFSFQDAQNLNKLNNASTKLIIKGKICIK